MFIINIIFVLREHNFLSQRRWSWHQRGYCKRQLEPANTKLTTNTRKLLNEGPLFSSYYLFAFVCKCAACFCFPRYCCNVLLLLLLLLFFLYIFFSQRTYALFGRWAVRSRLLHQLPQTRHDETDQHPPL